MLGNAIFQKSRNQTNKNQFPFRAPDHLGRLAERHPTYFFPHKTTLSILPFPSHWLKKAYTEKPGVSIRTNPPPENYGI